VVVSLATQLGIPLNLLIDVLFNPSGSAAALDSMAIAGVALMLASFTLSAAADHLASREQPQQRGQQGQQWEGEGDRSIDSSGVEEEEEHLAGRQQQERTAEQQRGEEEVESLLNDSDNG
jgi:hypothetical protein